MSDMDAVENETPSLDLSGRQIGQYRLVQIIGRGGMATVYRVADTRTGGEVALKLLHPQLTVDPRVLRRFKREAKTLLQVKHPGIVPLLDYGQEGEHVYLVMPWIRFGSLAGRLGRGALTPQEGARIIGQVAHALKHAHDQGIIHRDVKPGNILIDAEGNALLSDFGFVLLHDASISLTGSLMVGTPAYMAPEQVLGETVGPACDQYALAVILYQITTGALPYDADTPLGLAIKHATQPLTPPREVNANIPNAVEQVLVKALAKSPAERYATILDFNEAFQEALLISIDSASGALKQGAIRAEATTLELAPELGTGPDQGRRRRRILVAGALALLLLCPTGYWVYGSLKRPPASRLAPTSALQATPDLTSTAISIAQALALPGGTGLPLEEVQTAVAGTMAALPTQTPLGLAEIGDTLIPSATGSEVAVQPGAFPTPPLFGGEEATNTLQATPTRTSQPTETAAFEPTSTRTVSPVPSASPSPTPTPLPSSTPSQPPPSATNTPDICSLVDLQPAGRNGQEVSVRIYNNTPAAIEITGIYLEWPGSNDALKKIELAGSELWSGEDNPPSANLSGLGGNRTISAGGNKMLVVFFNSEAASTGYLLRFTLSNGCMVQEGF